jgi:hypothetical protein
VFPLLDCAEHKIFKHKDITAVLQIGSFLFFFYWGLFAWLLRPCVQWQQWDEEDGKRVVFEVRGDVVLF